MLSGLGSAPPCRHRHRLCPGTRRQVKGHIVYVRHGQQRRLGRSSRGRLRAPGAVAARRCINRLPGGPRRICEHRVRLGFHAAPVLTGASAGCYHYDRNKRQTAAGLTLGGGGMGARRRNRKTTPEQSQTEASFVELAWLVSALLQHPPFALPLQGLWRGSPDSWTLHWQLAAGGAE